MQLTLLLCIFCTVSCKEHGRSGKLMQRPKPPATAGNVFSSAAAALVGSQVAVMEQAQPEYRMEIKTVREYRHWNRDNILWSDNGVDVVVTTISTPVRVEQKIQPVSAPQASPMVLLMASLLAAIMVLLAALVPMTFLLLWVHYQKLVRHPL